MTPETKLKNQVQRYLKSLSPNCWFFKVVGGPSQKPGVPDIVGCYNGKFFALENKAEDGEVSDRQDREIALIRRAGGRAKVVRSIDEVVEIMEAM